MSKIKIVYSGGLELFSWHDGDTCYGAYDQGCRSYIGSASHPARFRMALINAAELAAPLGPADTVAAERLAPPGVYQAYSTGLDEYGRPILDIVLADGQLFSAAMLTVPGVVPYK